jgi:hypothetical protein
MARDAMVSTPPLSPMKVWRGDGGKKPRRQGFIDARHGMTLPPCSEDFFVHLIDKQ